MAKKKTKKIKKTKAGKDQQLGKKKETARDRTQDDMTRLAEQENRAAMIHSEMRELMDERRQVLTELGNLGARRGQAEAELSTLLDQAEALAIISLSCWLFGSLIELGIVTHPFAFLQNTAGLPSSYPI